MLWSGKHYLGLWRCEVVFCWATKYEKTLKAPFNVREKPFYFMKRSNTMCTCSRRSRQANKQTNTTCTIVLNTQVTKVILKMYSLAPALKTNETFLWENCCKRNWTGFWMLALFSKFFAMLPNFHPGNANRQSSTGGRTESKGGTVGDVQGRCLVHCVQWLWLLPIPCHCCVQTARLSYVSTRGFKFFSFWLLMINNMYIFSPFCQSSWKE